MKKTFRIGDYTDQYKEAFCGCLAPGEATIQEAGNLKAAWLERHSKDEYGVKLAFSEEGEAVGMIQYISAEHSQIECPGAWFVFCIWIPPKKRNGGVNWRKMGIGKALLEAAEKEVREKGATALVAWGTTLPVFMKSSWFKRQGYLAVEKSGISELVWKPFTEGAQKPRWRRLAMEPNTEPKESKTATVQVDAYINGICPAMNAVHARFRRAADELAGKITMNTYKDALMDLVYINGKEFSLGPPPSYKKILKTLQKESQRSLA